MPKNISAPSISVYCHGWVLQLQGGEEGGAGGDARDAAGGGAEAEGDAGVGRAQLLAPGVTRLQQIKQRRHLASLHYKQILRWCIGGLAQMAATYHTAGLSPHFSLPCKLQSPLFFPVFPFSQSATRSHRARLIRDRASAVLPPKPSNLRRIRTTFK